jgi:hypothetical protein
MNRPAGADPDVTQPKHPAEVGALEARPCGEAAVSLDPRAEQVAPRAASEDADSRTLVAGQLTEDAPEHVQA